MEFLYLWHIFGVVWNLHKLYGSRIQIRRIPRWYGLGIQSWLLQRSHFVIYIRHGGWLDFTIDTSNSSFSAESQPKSHCDAGLGERKQTQYWIQLRGRVWIFSTAWEWEWETAQQYRWSCTSNDTGAICKIRPKQLWMSDLFGSIWWYESRDCSWGVQQWIPHAMFGRLAWARPSYVSSLPSLNNMRHNNILTKHIKIIKSNSVLLPCRESLTFQTLSIHLQNVRLSNDV